MYNYKFSIFRRIKPEVLKSIYDELQDSPALLKSVIEELQTNYSIFDLTLGTATRIFTCYSGDIFKPFNESDFIKLFN